MWRMIPTFVPVFDELCQTEPRIELTAVCHQKKKKKKPTDHSSGVKQKLDHNNHLHNANYRETMEEKQIPDQSSEAILWKCL